METITSFYTKVTQTREAIFQVAKLTIGEGQNYLPILEVLDSFEECDNKIKEEM